MGSHVEKARTALDAHVREIVNWHFDPATGSPFWLDYAKQLGWDPRKEVKSYDDLAAKDIVCPGLAVERCLEADDG